LKRPHIAHEDGRFPVYVVFTTRSGLAKQYDPQSVQAIDVELKRLVKVIHGHRISQELWGSLLFYADDLKSTQAYGLQPALYNDPWKLKLIISDLDAAMQKRGERIGALLIVGGPEIVPFHSLPNPVEDADNEVPSDNPYSTRDDNYFISDWPVGRVSGGTGAEPDSILKVIREITDRYDEHASKPSWYLRLLAFFRELIKTGVSKKLSSFGYTAAVWRRASLSVFRSIGNPEELLISPPVHACEVTSIPALGNGVANTSRNGNTCLVLPDTRLAYFNLHGVPDSSEWYGQSDPALPEDGPEFPVAMRPRDIRNGGSAPRMVFTEACYGANIIGKMVDEAISLKFLASGTQAIIGSTCISYGSLSTPLSSADLLGRVFWSHLQEGFTVGESLRRAKIQMTREMNTRQGFLDAEDQKTLISFVLFGDPLAQPFQTKITPKITPHLSDAAVPVRTVCERSCEGEAGSTVSLETISHLKSIVAQYLPGMNDAKVNLYHEHQTCANLCGHCGTGKKCGLSSGKNQTPLRSQRRVITLSKNFERDHLMHRQYARVTLDDRGRIVKMVVSH
ncbi:MAG TPA: C25 family cysteine peptidase, partial [Anaerolineales bacterium]|nr:C25 family cysteine peptidase [Anaerolineales bacterium]